MYVSTLLHITLLSNKHFLILSQKPHLHMAHFKRTRPGTEPGSVPGPVTRLFTLSGPGTAPTRSSTWPPSICAMQCLCSSLFLDFDDVTELRWPVCCDHENDNFHLLHFSLFANSRRHSADQLSPRYMVIIAFLCRPTGEKIS